MSQEFRRVEGWVGLSAMGAGAGMWLLGDALDEKTLKFLAVPTVGLGAYTLVDRLRQESIGQALDWIDENRQTVAMVGAPAAVGLVIGGEFSGSATMKIAGGLLIAPVVIAVGFMAKRWLVKEVEAVEQVWDRVKDAAQEAEQDVVQVWDRTKMTIEGAVDDAANKIQEVEQKVLGSWYTPAKDASSIVSQTRSNVDNTIITGVEHAAQEVGSFFSSLF